NGSSLFDKPWIVIDTNRRSRHFGRVYVSWAIGTSDEGLRVFVSYADAHRDGTHGTWSRPRQILQQTAGTGENGSVPRVTADGRRWRAPLQVDDSSGDGEALQPGVAVAPNGHVAVAFYDRRLPCPARDTAEATIAGLRFDPHAPFGRTNYCINAAVQFYTATL